MASMLLAGLCVGGLLSIRIQSRMRARARQARRHLYILYDIAELTELPIEDLAPLFGTGPGHLERWKRTGVPLAQQARVVDILHATLALRHVLSAPLTRRLLVLRARHAAMSEEDLRSIAELSRRRASNQIVVTTR